MFSCLHCSMKSIKNPCSIIIIVKKKKLPQELSLTLFILRHFLTQEKKNYCRTAEKDVRLFTVSFKSSVPGQQRHCKSTCRKRLHHSSPLNLPRPEDKSLLIRMKRSHEGEAKGLNAHMRRIGTGSSLTSVQLRETEGWTKVWCSRSTTSIWYPRTQMMVWVSLHHNNIEPTITHGWV